MKLCPLNSRMGLLCMEPLQVYFLSHRIFFLFQCTRIVETINFTTELDFLISLYTRILVPFTNNILESDWKSGFVSF